LQPEDQAGQRVSALARADLAYAELAQGHAEVAEETLAPIWELESGQTLLPKPYLRVPLLCQAASSRCSLTGSIPISLAR
jgi:hypothetical protein